MQTPSILSENTLLYGTDAPLPAQRLLVAGPMTVTYENGALRYLRIGGTEAVRMIYSAVRDQNWDIIEPEIREELIEEREDSFSVKLKVAYEKGNIHFLADYVITGTADGSIRFAMDGECMSAFLKNRIGFCVLHPIASCAGKMCTITEPDGETKQLEFPSLISPRQPFTNIKTMSWSPEEGLTASLKFDGDIFETEDQRNWTDASYKTYCTPLEKPFPVNVVAGQKFRQIIDFEITGKIEISDARQDIYRLFINHDQTTPLPEIGVGGSLDIPDLLDKDILEIRSLNFKHYRIDVKLAHDDWEKRLRISLSTASTFSIPLFIALHTGGVENEYFSKFTDLVQTSGCKVSAILLLQAGSKTTPAEVIIRWYPMLKRTFPQAKIGAGTDAYFAELNRAPVNTENLDFVSFSINPQVHAFDHQSLIESIDAQTDTIKSAKAIFPGKLVAVSPVTLKPRFNPNAIETGGSIENQPGTDPRQASLFAVGWTLGSINALAEADYITYYQATGPCGFIHSENAPQTSSLPFPSGYCFPMLMIFKLLAQLKGNIQVKKVTNNNPLSFSALVVGDESEEIMLIASHKNVSIIIEVSPVNDKSSCKYLNANMLRHLDWPDRFENASAIALSITDNTTSVTLDPLALVLIKRAK
ncbi:hypothetical protein [Dyadobacter bucti]|uniref:hypothetical protein n=1 Tax=Dyadobacter bucti TaxID=2572203 RepID=UPI0011086278|nr:hypothetical protein [Dyadobacter bucti]